MHVRLGRMNWDLTRTYEMLPFGSTLVLQDLLDDNERGEFSAESTHPYENGHTSRKFGIWRITSSVTVLVRSQKKDRRSVLNNAISTFEASRFGGWL